MLTINRGDNDRGIYLDARNDKVIEIGNKMYELLRTEREHIEWD